MTDELEMELDFEGQFILNKINIEDGEGTGAIQQVPDGVKDGFDFTGKNPNATALDPTLTGTIPYGATGDYSASFGGKSASIGKRSYSSGTNVIAKGDNSHGEGNNNVSLGDNSHAEGNTNVVCGDSAHVEGENNVIDYGADYAHVSGTGNLAKHSGAHLMGEGLESGRQNQTVVGEYNSPNADALFVVGNGTENEKNNALVVKEDGTTALGSDPKVDMDAATKQYVDQLVAETVAKYLEKVMPRDGLSRVYGIRSNRETNPDGSFINDGQEAVIVSGGVNGNETYRTIPRREAVNSSNSTHPGTFDVWYPKLPGSSKATSSEEAAMINAIENQSYPSNGSPRHPLPIGMADYLYVRKTDIPQGGGSMSWHSEPSPDAVAVKIFFITQDIEGEPSFYGFGYLGGFDTFYTNCIQFAGGMPYCVGHAFCNSNADGSINFSYATIGNITDGTYQNVYPVMSEIQYLY